jgi:hypothetical protein
MEFNNTIVADRITEIIGHQVASMAKDTKGSKYFRGTTSNVNGNMADVYLFNSATPVYNIRIGNGLKHLTTGEEVLVLAINGNLSNSVIDKRVIDYNLLYGEDIENCKTISDFEPYIDWTSNDMHSVWDRSNFKVKDRASRMIYDNLTTSYLYTYYGDPINLEEFKDGQASTEADFIFLSMYFINSSIISDLEFSFSTYTDGSYDYTYDGTLLTNGWNSIKIKKSDFALSATPIWSNITTIDLTTNFSTEPTLDDYFTYAYLGMYRPFDSGINSSVQTEIDAITAITNLLTLNSHRITISASTPVSPVLGDIWFDIS